ncbi:hypothetical protein PS943_01480 [Pseudomonas fluorescens]|uniref:Lipoprotein n=1 Tax=Pseudomonas fluorescens TaxID=294 RepID=A0A5E7W493_PSEFL|nr:hypothetical protein [Pseudomonas fluorescens]VVQ29751.1 hypothetical protein PS943_01480 [Pseudomonas fluorescens]
MWKILTALALIALAGCSTSQVPIDKAQPVPADRILAYASKPAEPYGTIVVTRDTGLVGGACFVGVLVDGKFTARIDTGEIVSLYVPVGEHLIGLAGDKHSDGVCGWGELRKEQSTNISTGQLKRFRIGGDTNIGLDIRPSSI